jgi:rfaE bifunctional protein nucleotidyltransferase chain/domain
MRSKILTEKKLISLKNAKKKIVLCHGVFDLFHVGHVKHFKEAKKFGDILIVSVTTDKYVNKGPGRPFFNTNQRMELLSEIKIIDFVISSDSVNSVNLINKIKPDFYFKGPDYKKNKDDFTGFIKTEINAVKKHKGTVIYSSGETFSSSKVINEISNLSDSQKKLISDIKQKYTFEQISSQILKKINRIKVLVIGEMIIDRFIFCTALGKSGKEAILNLEKKLEKELVGGVGAIANHLSDFSKNIKLISYLGENKQKKRFIINNLKKNITFDYLTKNFSSTITKSKIIDISNGSKLLGLYDFNDKKLSSHENQIFKSKIKKNLNNCDIIIVSDYGHSFINQEIANYLAKNKKVIVNTQLNAANLGYHTIGKYKKSNWVIINEVELRHELRDRYEDLKKLMIKLSIKLKIKNLIVTCGKNGAYYYSRKNNKYIFCPAFANKVVDKIGSGDSFMSIFSVMNNCFPKDVQMSLFIASLATIQVLEDYGNTKTINLNSLLKAIKYILK